MLVICHVAMTKYVENKQHKELHREERSNDSRSLRHWFCCIHNQEACLINAHIQPATPFYLVRDPNLGNAATIYLKVDVP